MRVLWMLVGFLVVLAGCAPGGGRVDGPRGIQGVQEEGSYFYVVPVDGGVVVVDTGSDESAARLKETIAGRPVVAVLLTHSHADHQGGAAALGDVPVYVHADELSRVKGQEPHKGLVQRLTGPTRSPPAEPTHLVTVADGHVLAVGGAEFHAIHMPGHTPGSMVWRYHNVLFGGDAVFGGRRLGTAPPVFSDDDRQARASLTKLRDVDFDTLLDGHNGRTDDAKAKLP